MEGITVSKHAKERFAERIMDRSTVFDINKFIVENEEKIETDISKMVNYGTLVYTGKQYRDNKNNTVKVYVNGCWIVLMDASNNKIITLYKIDLVAGDDEFNKEYIKRKLSQLENAKEALETATQKRAAVADEYLQKIKENERQIAEFRSCIKNLENLNESYRQIMENNVVEVKQAEMDVVEVINSMLGKKEF